MKQYSFNQIKFGGRLGRDPDLKYTLTQSPVCSFSVCYVHKKNKKETKTWMNVVVWGSLAEDCKKVLRKGSPVIIEEGSIATRSYNNRDGQKVYVTEITARKIDFMEEVATDNYQSGNRRENGYAPDNFKDSDIPF